MTATARKKSPLVLIRGNVRQEVRTAQIDERPTTPIGLKPAPNRCSYCGIECKQGKAIHYRCQAVKDRDEQRALGRYVANYVWWAV